MKSSKNSYNDFGSAVTNFLGKFLPAENCLSTNTILSYRDTFKLYIEYMGEKGTKISSITFDDFSRENILGFLDWLEIKKGNKASTCNVRLAALHAFANYLMIDYPEFMHYATIILSVKKKKTVKPTVGYLTIDEIRLLLKKAKENSYKHYVVLSTLYETGCRVQEICDLKWSDIRTNTPATITVKGKGNKKRVIPISDELSSLLAKYKTNAFQSSSILTYVFTNHSNSPITREGIAHIVKKYAELSKLQEPNWYQIKVSPHILRHTRAMILLQSGVDLIYIRDILGHVDLKTTEIYARIDSEMKRKALLKVNNIVDGEASTIWNTNKDLLAWLNSLKK